MDDGAGKGDKRRPRGSNCSKKEFEMRWEMAFGKKDEVIDNEKITNIVNNDRQ